MQRTAPNSFVLTDVSSLGRMAGLRTRISQAEFYQVIASKLVRGVHKREVSGSLGENLVAMAEKAHAFRQMEMLDQMSQALTTLPLSRSYEAIGRYYQGVSTQRFGRGDLERAIELFERAAESAPPHYRIRAIISLAANSRHKSDNQTALSLYSAAGQLVSQNGVHDLYAMVHTHKMVAVINSEEGNHQKGLALLETLFPVANALRASQPQVFFDYLNSFAVELCAVGRLEEARNVSAIVIASPFAAAYPEWRETHDEIELRGYRSSRATVAFHNQSARYTPQTQPPANIMHLRLRERAESAVDSQPGTKPARILSLHEWKTRMAGRSNVDPQEHTPRPVTSKEKQARINTIGKMTIREKLLTIMKVIGDERVGDDLLLRALIILEELETDNNPES